MNFRTSKQTDRSAAELYAVKADYARFRLKGSKLAPGFFEILIPGEMVWRERKKCLQHGILLLASTYHELWRLGVDLGVSWPSVK